jgi:N-acetylneuraminic acid mutarotase
MIVYGGFTSSGGTVSALNDGYRYNPLTNAWSALPVNSLGGRRVPAVVWTGSRLIVWGGLSVGASPTYFDDGAMLTLGDASWVDMTETGAPSGRWRSARAWTGSQLLIFGGLGSAGVATDGGAYDPARDAWSPLPSVGAPTGRHSAVSAHTGDRWFVWGGADFGGTLATGAVLHEVCPD